MVNCGTTELLQISSEAALEEFHGLSVRDKRKPVQSGFQNRWQLFVRCGFALLLFEWCGCAHLAVVKTKPAQRPKALVGEASLQPAERYLAAAEGEQPLVA